MKTIDPPARLQSCRDAGGPDHRRGPHARWAATGAALSGIRPDDLAAHVVSAAVERTGLDPARDRRRLHGRGQPVGRGQPRRRPHGRAARRPAGRGARGDGQPALRVGPRGRQPGLPRPAPRRGRPLPRRRRRVDEPRALGDAEAGAGPAARRADPVRHRPRLAHGQPADGGAATRPSRWARPARTSPSATAISREDQDALCAAEPPARRRRAGGGPLRRPDRRRSRCPRRRRDEPTPSTADEGPRDDTSLEKLARLRPAFREGGTVTAGNSSTLNDGAACLVLADEEAAGELGAEPLARIVSIGVAGVDPAYMGIGPMRGDPEGAGRAPGSSWTTST